LALYLSNRARAIWQTKPDTSVNVMISLEDLVLKSLQLENADKTKLIEHQTADLTVKDADVIK
jgi:hypothetical protein